MDFGYLSEIYRHVPLRNGKQDGKKGTFYVFPQSFLLYRGTRLSIKLLNEWYSGIGQEILLPQPTSTTTDFKQALDAALEDKELQLNGNSIGQSDAKLKADIATSEEKE